MKQKLWIALFPLLAPLSVPAQEALSFAEIDSLSYQAYLSNDWKEVRRLADGAFGLGYDYYFLRMRAGVAELGLNRPLRAEKHFTRALDFSSHDPNALAYRYLSLIASGRFNEGRLTVDSVPADARERFGIPTPRILSSVFLEPGYMFATRAGELKSAHPDAPISHHYLVPTYSYFGAGLNLNPHKRLYLTLAVNQLRFFALQYFTLAGLDPFEFEIPFDQKAFYLTGSWYFGKGFSATLAGQILSATYPLREWEEGVSSGSYEEVPYFYRDVALHASLSKQLPRAVVSVSGDWNRFKNNRFVQGGAGVTLYPAGNTNTWIRGEATIIADSSRSAARAVSTLSAGRKLFGTTWLEGYWSFGRITDYSEKGAWVVYNNYDPIQSRAGINLLIYNLTRTLDLAIRYQWSSRISTWQLYDGNGTYTGDFEKTYQMHSLTGGITWRF